MGNVVRFKSIKKGLDIQYMVDYLLRFLDRSINKRKLLIPQ
jgi:hypothetical protein